MCNILQEFTNFEESCRIVQGFPEIPASFQWFGAVAEVCKDSRDLTKVLWNRKQNVVYLGAGIPRARAPRYTAFKRCVPRPPNSGSAIHNVRTLCTSPAEFRLRDTQRPNVLYLARRIPAPRYTTSRWFTRTRNLENHMHAQSTNQKTHARHAHAQPRDSHALAQPRKSGTESPLRGDWK